MMTSSSDSFFLQCPSNASMQIFPNNTLAEYTNHLETALEMETNQWEVGCAKFNIPKRGITCVAEVTDSQSATNHLARRENGPRSIKRCRAATTQPFPTF